MLKVSIITVSYNSAATIRETIESVLGQSYSNIEYIVIDGASNDGTAAIVKSYADQISYFVSEPDSGIYDAMNKGIARATGDIVGILNADDHYIDNEVVTKIVEAFTPDVDAVYGDVQFENEAHKVVRYYSSRRFNVSRFRFGFMPAHPSFYVRRIFFDKFGRYSNDYRIAADFDLLLRFLLIHKIRTRYISMPFVSMRTGGASNNSLKSNVIINREILRSCKENGVRTNWLNIYSKYFIKIFEYIGN